MSRNQHLHRWGASLMAWILVLSMCTGLVLPAYATEAGTEPTDTTEATQATEATNATETTGTTETTDATEVTQATDTTEVAEPEGLTAEEQAQAEAVLTALNALESADQVETNLAALEEDPEGYAAYYNQALAATQAVRDAYAALTDAQKKIVGDITKLTDLDWLVSREFLPEGGNQSEILTTLTGDYAYINSIAISALNDHPMGMHIITGTAPFDYDNIAGNDASMYNNVVRTFDTIEYKIDFSAVLHTAMLDNNYSGIKQGRLYFEFIVKGDADDIRFETTAMPFLNGTQGLVYKTCTVKIGEIPHQVLRGSYIWTPTDGNDIAITGSADLKVVLRVLQMKNGDEIQPTFTMWLEGNDVGVDYGFGKTDGYKYLMGPEDVLTEADLVTCLADPDTGKGPPCAETVTLPNGTETVHNVSEACSITAPYAIKTSAKPMFNVVLWGVDSRNTRVGSYDFGDTEVKYINSDGEEATVINSGMGVVSGRLNGYGLVIELNDGTSRGMLGAEFPDEDSPITFIVNLSTEFEPTGGSRIADSDYQPLFWSGGGNGYLWQNKNTTVMDNENRRPVNTDEPAITLIPFNRNINNENKFRECVNGGNWSFEYLNANQIQVTIKDFTFDTSHFPWSRFGDTDTSYYYYDAGDDYWEMNRAIFSVGEIWILQPYYDSNGLKISEKYNSNGMFYTHVKVTDFSMNSLTQTVTPETETNKYDNEWNTGQQLMLPGSIINRVEYMEAGTTTWNASLTAGGYGRDTDWATAGSSVTLKFNLTHNECEGDYAGVAYDILMKFDDEFFVPQSWAGIPAPLHTNVLWAFRSENPKAGWTDLEEMKEATVDNLIYINGRTHNISTLLEEGYVPVGVLVEYRDVVTANMNVRRTYFYGNIPATCPTGQVYMLTQNTYAWTKQDVADAALAYCNGTKYQDAPLDNPSQLTDEDYNYYVQNGMPTRSKSNANSLFTIPTQILNSDRSTAGVDYPTPFFRQDYYYTSDHGDLNSDGSATASPVSLLAEPCYPASYNNGTYKSGGGAPYFQDSCLVMPYQVSVLKSVAQTNEDGTAKEYYFMDYGQRTVVYQNQVSISRNSGKGDSTSADQSGIVYVEDILPAELQFCPGTAYYGGAYTQDPTYQTAGTFTGTAFADASTVDYTEPTPEHPLLLRVTVLDDGRTKLLFMIHTDMNLNGTTDLPLIRYACSIGTPGDEENDVSDDDQLTSEVSVWATGDSMRPRKADYNNFDTCTIKITKNSAASLSKLSDMLVAELTDDLGFTMNAGNNSNSTKTDTLIVETLPFQGLYGTNFHGPLKVEGFSAAVLDSNSQPVSNNFLFYYTTDTRYAGLLSADLRTALTAEATDQGMALGQWLADDTSPWLPLSFGSQTEEIKGLPLYPAAIPENQEEQIVSIIALGDLPPNSSMRLHITMKLPQGLQGDYLVNYLSQENLSCYARTQIVRRTLEGYTWLDTNMDGIQDDGEQPINGIQVTLKRLEGDTYVSVCYPGTDIPIVIHTGEQVSVLASADAITNYADGRYKFTELPAGTYRVFFESGVTDISDYTASPVQAGSDTAADSDGVPTYSNGILLNTQISDIVLSPVDQLTYGIQESRCHDSGFYPTVHYELPLTGGTGTGGFTVIGLLLTAAALGLMPRKKKKH